MKSVATKAEVNGEQSNTLTIVVLCQSWVDDFVASIFQLPDFSWNTKNMRYNRFHMI